MPIPTYKNRNPEQILDSQRLFDSAWHIWQSLSWLDYAKRKTSVTALQYAALELRLGIEHLWFDMIVTAVGGDLDKRDYSRCKGDSTRMYKILDRLIPDYEKLVRFSNLSANIDKSAPPLIEWEMSRLRRLHGEASPYLHFLGLPGESTDSAEWFVASIATLENGGTYIWNHITAARIGQLNIESMPAEVRDAWEGFRTGQLTEDEVRIRLQLAQPALRNRRQSQ